LSKTISVRLSEDDFQVLNELGGKSEGLRRLIEFYRQASSARVPEHDLSPDDRFYRSIILPSDFRLRETYQAFLEVFIESGLRKGSLDFYVPIICGRTGFDADTVRKHFRKLATLRFVHSSGWIFRPTLRLKDGVDFEHFRKIYQDFVDFLQANGAYRDVSTDLWEEEEDNAP